MVVRGATPPAIKAVELGEGHWVVCHHPDVMEARNRLHVLAPAIGRRALAHPSTPSSRLRPEASGPPSRRGRSQTDDAPDV